MRTPLQVSYWRAWAGRPLIWHGQNAAGLEDAAGFAQVPENHVAAGDVLEDGVGVDEIEAASGKMLRSEPEPCWGNALGMPAQALARQADHLVGNVDAVDLVEMAAHGAHQASGTAADFERGLARSQARQLALQVKHNAGSRGEELVVILLRRPKAT